MNAVNYTRAGYFHTNDTTIGQPFPPMAGGCGGFRIPGLIVLNNGDLFATCDARWSLPDEDYGGIDTIYALSRDGGKTWKNGYAAYFPDSFGTPRNVHDVTTCIDSDPVQTPDGRIHIFINMNPTGITSGLKWPCTGTGMITVDGVKRPALTDRYEDVEKPYGEYPYYIGELKDGFAPVMKTNGESTAYSVDEFFNIYLNGEILTQKQADTGETIAQNVFYRDSALHVYNTMFTLHVYSDDGAQSWHWELADIKTENESACISAPGNAIITDEGKTVLPFYTMDTQGFYSSHAVISEDNGRTWKRSPYLPVTKDIPFSGECKPVDLGGGRIRMFFRNGIKRICYADYDLRAEKWDEPVILPVRVHSDCNFGAAKTGDRILIAYAEGEGDENLHRTNGRIYVFTLNGKNEMTLEKTVPVTNKAFSYAVIAMTDEKTACVLYDTCADGLVFFTKAEI